MKPADFAVADAAAVSTGKWTRADDGTVARPVYRSGNPPRVAQVSYVPGSIQAAHYESFVSSYLWGSSAPAESNTPAGLGPTGVLR